MKIQVVHGQLETTEMDAIVLGLFEGVTDLEGAAQAADQALSGAIGEVIAAGDFTGKSGTTVVLYPRGSLAAKRVILLGLGKMEALDLEGVRCAAAVMTKKAGELNARSVGLRVLRPSGMAVAEGAQAMAEGVLLALYQYNAPKTTKPKPSSLESVLIYAPQEHLEEVEAAVRTAEAIASGVSLARDLVNMPPNQATPAGVAAAAEKVAKEFGLAAMVGDRDWAASHKMGAFLAVGQGAGFDPKFVVLEYNREKTDLPLVVLVGKGITFDTGGISLKPGEKMEAMKSDMAGAAAVIGAMKAVAALKLPVRVVGITPLTENMPDANAYRPADVITASNGKTIEIISTDAEGRMVLADALVYAKKYEPKAVIDLATLTGACVVALGQGMAAGLFCTEDWLSEKLLASGTKTHERLWRLPLWDDYSKAIKSEVADMKNSGGRFGGVATSAVFLKEFTDYAWAHLDIAGMALSEKPSEYTPVGATGFGVRLLVEFLRGV